MTLIRLPGTRTVLGMALATTLGLLPSDILAQRPAPPLAAQNRPPVGPNLDSLAVRNLTSQAAPSIVLIESIGRPRARCGFSTTRHMRGSGFVVDPAGWILTSSRLVYPADQVRVRLIDGTEFVPTEVRVDPRSGVSVVKITPAANLPALSFGDSNAVRVGDWVVAAGQNSPFAPTAATGVINTLGPGPGLARGETFFQTDAALTQGVGGGPLLNLNGQVIGLTDVGPSAAEDPDRVGMAAPSNLVSWATRQLIDHGFVTRGYLGIQTRVTSHAGSPAPPVPGVIVDRVLPNTPAAAATLQPGDVITRLDGNPIVNLGQLVTVSERLTPGKNYPVEVVRGGKTQSLNVVAAQMPAEVNVPRVVPPNNAVINSVAAPTLADYGIDKNTLAP